VQLHADYGSLYSDGRALVTDAKGLARDRLTANRPCEVIVQVGDMRYRFTVSLAPTGS
jgi:hypothetical protein